MNQYQSIRIFQGIGEKRLLAFHRLGIDTVFDLITYFPRRYEDRSIIKPIDQVQDGETVCVETIIASEPSLARIRRGLEIVKFRAVDDSGMMDISYFNQSYIRTQFHKGDSVRFYGKVQIKNRRVTMTNPVADHLEKSSHQTGSITPVYKTTQGLTQNNIRNTMEQALAIANEIPEILPPEVLKEFDLCPSGDAFIQIHRPEDYNKLEYARNRFVFEEFFRLCITMQYLRQSHQDIPGIRMTDTDEHEFLNTLPYFPTNAQKRAMKDIRQDLESGNAMNRLIQGDVGSGKTLVASYGAWLCCRNGCQSAMMAPTEILAEQHYRTFLKQLSPYGIRIALLTGSTPAKEKREIKEQLLDGTLDFVIGTHALFSEDVQYRNLALVITDEQHRFGVSQRNRLVQKSANAHVLVMSATPIPRTLALMIYGDLDVSVIDEMPPGRKPVETFAVNNSYRARLNAFIQKTVDAGQQVYVVCPAIEENESFPLTTVEEHHQALKKALPRATIAIVHGKMKEQEKDRIMRSFSEGDIDVLVSTTVIEVGVDVPNAALIIIEDADRFGMSQLHQLRGRVGRGEAQSYCILVSDTTNENAAERLKLMTKTQSGFEVAEKDLAMRGPGDFFGDRQHGLPPIRIADLCSDMSILQQAQSSALELIRQDPRLAEPEHRELLKYVQQNASTLRGSIN